MIDALVLLQIGFVGTFVWVFNAEAAAVVQVTQRGWNPLPVALLLTAGQTGAGLVLFWAGHRIRARWPYFDKQCQRVQQRWGPRLTKRSWVAIATAGLLGLPPMSALTVVAPGFAIPLSMLLPITIVTRVARFVVIGLLSHQARRFHFG